MESSLMPPAATPALNFVGQQILHIKLWYQDGSQRELNITSPHTSWGEDLETQYLYMRMYLRKVAPCLGITAYQGHICCIEDNGPRILGTYAKVDCSAMPPYKPGQYFDERD